MDQQGTGLRLGELLVQWGWVDSAAISQALAEQYEMDFFDLDAAEIDPAAVQRLSARDARSYDAIPISYLADGRLLVGVADPTDVGALRRASHARWAARSASSSSTRSSCTARSRASTPT